MTLNGVMAFLLRYFTEFLYAVVVKQLLGLLPRFQNLLLIVYNHINTICAIIQRVFGQNEETIASTPVCRCLRPYLLMSFLYQRASTAGWMGESTLSMADR